ncbi:PKD domain-containing protein [Bacteroidota bacterium]
MIRSVKIFLLLILAFFTHELYAQTIDSLKRNEDDQSLITLYLTDDVTSITDYSGIDVFIDGTPATFEDAAPSYLGSVVTININEIPLDGDAVELSYDGPTGNIITTAGALQTIPLSFVQNDRTFRCTDFLNGGQTNLGTVPPGDICAPVTKKHRYSGFLKYAITQSDQYANISDHILIRFEWNDATAFITDNVIVELTPPDPYSNYEFNSTAQFDYQEEDPCGYTLLMTPGWDSNANGVLTDPGDSLCPSGAFGQAMFQESNPFPVWETDDRNTGTVQLDPILIEHCVNTPMDTMINDNSEYNCRVGALAIPPDDPNFANLRERYIRFTYGTTTGRKIPNIYINGIRITGDDGQFIDQAATDSTSGFGGYRDTRGTNGIITIPQTVYPTEQNLEQTLEITMPNPGYEEIGDQLEVRIENWNVCNWNGGAGTPIIRTAIIEIVGEVDPSGALPGVYCEGSGIAQISVNNAPPLNVVEWYDDWDPYDPLVGTVVYNGGASGVWNTPPDLASPGNITYYAQYTGTCTSENRVPVTLTKNPKPNADFFSDTICYDGTTASNFDAGASIILYGSIDNYAWDVNEDGMDEYSGASSTESHLFVPWGNYPVRLIVTSDQNCTDTTYNNALVEPGSPGNALGPYSPGPLNVCQEDTWTYTILAIPNATEYIWTIPPNSQIIGPSDGNSITLRFLSDATSGNLEVYGRNSCGPGGAYTALITVNPKPVASFVSDPSCATDITTLDASASSISSGSITDYYWDIDNDGTYDDTLASSINTHIYTVVNIYPTQLLVESDLGCYDTLLQDVTVNPIPTASFTSNVICYDGSTQSDMDASASNISSGTIDTYRWDIDIDDTDDYINAIATQSHLFPAPGTHPVRLVVISNLNCTDTVTQDVLIHSSIPDAAVGPYAPGPLVVCQEETWIYTIPPINYATEYIWTIPPNSQIIGPTDGNSITLNFLDNATTGNLEVFARNACGDGNSFSELITVNPKPVASFVANPACAGEITSLDATGSTITSGLITTYYWDIDNDGTDDYTTTLDVQPHVYAIEGTYPANLIVESDQGCYDTLLQDVGVTVVPVADFISDQVCAFDTTTLDASASNVSSGTIDNYYWDIDNNGIDDYDTVAPIQLHIYTTGGSYDVQLIVETDRGCTDTLTQSVLVDIVPEVATISDDSICGDGTITIDAGIGVNGDIVDFSEDDGGSIASFDDTAPYEYDVGPLVAGSSQTIWVRSKINATGCASDWTNSATARANLVPDVATITDNERCADGQVLMSANVGTNGDIVDFSIDGGTSTIFSDTDGAPFEYNTVSITAPDTVTIHVRSRNLITDCPSSWFNSATAIAKLEPAITNYVGDENVCTGESTVIYRVYYDTPEPASTSFQWSLTTSSGNPPIMTPYNDLAVLDFDPPAWSGDLSVTVAAAGCTTIADVLNIQSFDNPVATAGPDKIICSGDTTYLEGAGSGGSGTYSFEWLPTSGLTDANIAQPYASLTGAVQFNQIYSLTVADSLSGCESASSTMTLTVNPKPVIYNLQGGGEYCEGSTDVFIGLDDSDPGVTYEMYLDGSPTGITSTPGGGSFNFPSLTSGGNYTIYATNGFSCTTRMNGDADIIINPGVSIDTLTSTTYNGYEISCDNGSNGEITVVVSGGTSPLEYTIDNGITYQTSSQFNGLAADTYTVMIRDAKGCTTSQDITLSEPTPLILTFDSKEDVLCGDSTTGSINVTVTGGVEPVGGYIYSWTGTDSLGNNFSSNLEDLTGLYAGTYDLIVTDDNGCSDNMQTVTVLPPGDLPLASLSGSTSICNGDSTLLTFNFTGIGPFDVTYSDGVNNITQTDVNDGFNVTVTPDTTTVYSIIDATDNNSPNCIITEYGDDVEVIVNDLPTAIIVSDTATVCSSEEINLEINLTGESPFTITYGDNYGSVYTENVGGNSIEFNHVPDIGETIYSLISVTDSNSPVCSGIVTGEKLAIVNERPTAFVSVGGSTDNVSSVEICKGDSTDVTFTFAGTAPYTLVYEVNESATYTVADITTSTYSITVEPDDDETYEIVSVSDSNNPVCDGSFSGRASVIINDTPVADFNADKLNGCAPLEINFDNFSTGELQGANSGYYYRESDDTAYTLLSNDLYTTFVFENNSDLNIDYEVMFLAESSLGCVDSTSKVITVAPSLQLDVSYNNNIDGCNPYTVTFNNNQVVDNILYIWDWGDGTIQDTTSSETTISHEFINNSTESTKTFGIQVTAINPDTECSDVAQLTIRVYPGINVDISSDINRGCAPLSVQFNNNSQGVSTHEWFYRVKGTSSVNDTATTQTVAYQFENQTQDSMIYEVIYSGTNSFNCELTDTLEIVVGPEFEAAFTALPERQVLPNSTVEITDQTNPGPWSYQWDFGEGNQSTDALLTEYTFDTYGTYHIVLDVSYGGCSDQATRIVVIEAITPVIEFTVDVIEGCRPLTVNFTSLAQFVDEDTYYWDFGDDQGNSSAINPTYTYNEPGIYTVELEGSNELGITVETRKEKFIIVHDVPTANFNVRPSIVYIPGQYVYTANGSFGDGILEYRWDWGDGDTTDTEFEPIHEYEEPGVYDVGLWVTNDYGCTDSLIIEKAVIAELGGDVETPNVFTPDPSGPGGGGGTGGGPGNPSFNNSFIPYMEGTVEFHMQIFNRWGEMLFESFDKNVGWDGWYNNKLAPADVYVYKLNVRLADGQRITRVGDVFLLR